MRKALRNRCGSSKEFRHYTFTAYLLHLITYINNKKGPMTSISSLERALQDVPVVNCVSLLRLLHAVDCVPRGGLYSGYYALAAATRYEAFWLKAMALTQKAEVPPLDIAFAWFVHRQEPADYRRVSGYYTANLHPTAQQAFAFDPTRCNKSAWEAAAGQHPIWPPPAPGSTHDPLATGSSVSAIQLASSMSRISRLLHSWLRPHFLDVKCLTRAQERYGRFLSLHAAHPDVLLVPPADVALVWHTHLGLSGEYAAACQALFGAAVPPWRPDYLDLSPDKLGAAYGLTSKLYMEKYGMPFDDADTAWLPHTMPYPLAAPDSPIAWALRVFDENPHESQQRSALLAAAARTGFPLVDVPVVRSGAHALFAAWLAARRAQKVYDAAISCSCGFPTSLETVFFITLKHTVACLVSVAYFLELPDKDSHPYITAIKLRRDLWTPPTATGAAGMSISPAVASGFSPYDPARYLSVRESHYLLGLATLLTSTKTQPAGEHNFDNALWLIVCKQGLRELADISLGDAQRRAAKHGVGHLQRDYKRPSDRNLMYTSTDYYTTDLGWWGRLERWLR